MVAHEAKPSPGRDEGDPDKPDRWIKHKMLQETQQSALVQSSIADLNSRKLVQQLKLGVVMFFLGSPVVIFLIGMGMDDRHPVHYMNVGKSYQASQIRYEK